LNNYYSEELKKDRIKILNTKDGFIFKKASLEDYRTLEETFIEYKPDIVINLAAQAGVRYSIENPRAYIDSNIVGFFNVLQCCREFPISHLLFASSSSVYGDSKDIPFSEEDNSDMPSSLYAATKKSDEVMAYSYSKLYGINMTGLRLFSVYGPYGRPDMAYYKFTDKITKGEALEVYNSGDMYRDFTYIDDVVEVIVRLLNVTPSKDKNNVSYKVYNVGYGSPESVDDVINILEKHLGKRAIRKNLPLQKGDVFITYAQIKELERIIGYKPKVGLEEGLEKFITWYKKYTK